MVPDGDGIWEYDRLMRLVFGAGFTGARVAALATERGEEVVAVVRTPESVARLQGRGFTVTREPVAEVARRWALPGAHAIVCLPPDGDTDALLAPLLARADAVTYVSTTSVYGEREGSIDDSTPVDASPSVRLAAEGSYRAIGATVLRAPGIYGPERGLHVRVTQGRHAVPGDGSNFVSRIHVDDLAELLLASRKVRGETFVVGDLEPATQREIVGWICTEYGCPFPPSVAASEVPETLRRNRRVDPRRALAALGVTLRYPSYRDGMKRSELERPPPA